MSQKPRHTGHNTDSGLHQIPPFEGIQVAPSQFPEAVRPPGDGLHNISTEIGLEPAPSSLAAEEKSVLEDRGVQRKRRLCGLRPITFWLLLVIVVLYAHFGAFSPHSVLSPENQNMFSEQKKVSSRDTYADPENSIE